MNDEDLGKLVATQSAMSNSMAAQSKTLSDISETLMAIQVIQGRHEERLIGILENNQRLESEVSILGGRVQKLENITTLNKFTLNFYPQALIIIGSVFAFALGLGMVIAGLIPPQ